MNIYKYTVGELPNIILPLGVQGENEARQIQIDFSEWMTEGVTGYPEIKVLTPGGTLYWATAHRGDEDGLENGDKIICWTLRNVDTGESGNGLIRVILFGENNERLKSMAARTYLAPEFDEAIEPPVAADIWANWVDQMGVNAATTQSNAYVASQAKDAAEGYAIAIKENRLDLIEGLMNLATTQEFSIATTDWEAVTGGYAYTLNVPIITEDTAALLHMDDTNAAKCQACIEMETGDGTITFTTDTIPTGDISGTLFLQGRFADAGLSNLSVKTTVTLEDDGWEGHMQTVSVPGMTADKTVIVSPTPSDYDYAMSMGVRCIAQGEDTLTFACSEDAEIETVQMSVLGL